MIPAALAALVDRRLHRSDLIVYGYALQELDVAVHRTMKLQALARQARMRKGNVSRALRRLAGLGYLEKGPVEGGLKSYRLLYSQVITSRAS